MRILNALDRKAPVHSLCLYRSGLGLIIFAETTQWLFNSRELFSNEGFHVPHLAWLPVPTALGADLLCLLLMVASLAMTVGLFTRPAILLTLASWGYLYALDSINEKAAETIVIVGLSFLFFSPCGYRLSLDNVWRKRRGLPEYPGIASSFTLNMLRFEFANIYFFCGLAKMTYPEWVNGTTFARVLNSRWATPLGVYLSTKHFALLARVGGLGTILFELSEGFLLLLPATRYFAIVIGICFHTGIQSTLFVGSLGFHFIWALICLFSDPHDVARIWTSNGSFRARVFARDRSP